MRRYLFIFHDNSITDTTPPKLVDYLGFGKKKVEHCLPYLKFMPLHGAIYFAHFNLDMNFG